MSVSQNNSFLIGNITNNSKNYTLANFVLIFIKDNKKNDSIAQKLKNSWNFLFNIEMDLQWDLEEYNKFIIA